jgi:hypothetical protein
LTVTSIANRTSPVLREMVFQNILDTASGAPPPPNVEINLIRIRAAKAGLV